MTYYYREQKERKKRNERRMGFCMFGLVAALSIWGMFAIDGSVVKKQPVPRKSSQPTVNRSNPSNNSAALEDDFNRGFNRELGSSKNIDRRNDTSLRKKINRRQLKRTADHYGISEEKFKKEMMNRALREMGY